MPSALASEFGVFIEAIDALGVDLLRHFDDERGTPPDLRAWPAERRTLAIGGTPHDTRDPAVIPDAFGITSVKPLRAAKVDIGVDTAWSCDEGVCGTCETGVPGGTPDHREQGSNGRMKAGGSGGPSEQPERELRSD